LADFEEPLSRLWVWDRTFLRWSRNGRLRAWLAFVTVGVRFGGGLTGKRFSMGTGGLLG
jgi:hypothetical protein